MSRARGNPFGTPRSWKARWIWCADGGTEKNAYYTFRKVFDLGAEASGCALYVSADTRYRLYVNGSFVG